MGDAQGELEDGTPVALVGVDLNAPTIRSMTDPAFFQGCPERIVKLLTPNPYSRSQDRLESVNDIVIHYVGNAGSSAMENRDYFESLQDGSTSASSHFIVGLEGEIVQCVPLSEIAYATKNRNVDTISIEICHPDADGKFSDVTYRSAIRLTAWLCKAFGIGPEHVIRHYDVTGKLCPLYYVEHRDAWEQFLADVKTEYEQITST
ncbi:MAG: N-acetylmuramoyl-L-alanine amidase [Lachnospiraceae bacterium]|nr:N-acetylmuramoyl-L-alanine amidase [Lachnospiraceae bacterium]